MPSNVGDLVKIVHAFEDQTAGFVDGMQELKSNTIVYQVAVKNDNGFYRLIDKGQPAYDGKIPFWWGDDNLSPATVEELLDYEESDLYGHDPFLDVLPNWNLNPIPAPAIQPVNPTKVGKAFPEIHSIPGARWKE